MNIRNIPENIVPFEKRHDEIFISEYKTNSDAYKEKSILNKNAVSLVLHGKKTMHFAQKTVNVNDNEIHLLSAGNCIASIDMSKQKEFISILMFFDNVVLKNFVMKNYDQIESVKTNSKIIPEFYVSFHKDAFIKNYISSVQSLLNSAHKQLSPKMMTIKFEELFQYLLEEHPLELLSFIESTSLKENELNIKKVIEQNVTNNLSIEELAFLCNLSVSTFKRRFNDIYKTTPSNWFLEQRMKIAKNLLRDFNEKPSEIYHKIGYVNHSSFSKSFKKIYGVTPKEFQNNI